MRRPKIGRKSHSSHNHAEKMAAGGLQMINNTGDRTLTRAGPRKKIFELIFRIITLIPSLPFKLALVVTFSWASLGLSADEKDHRLDELSQLEKRVSDLEAKQDPGPPLSNEAALLTRLELELTLPEALGDSHTGFGPSVSAIYESRTPMKFGLVADLRHLRFENGAAVDPPPSVALSESGIARGLFLFASRLSRGLFLNSGLRVTDSELPSWEAERTGFDFLFVEQRFGDDAGLRIGRIIVPIGLWNMKFEPTEFSPVRPTLTETIILPSLWRAMGGLAYKRLDRVTLQAAVVESLDASRARSSSWLADSRTSVGLSKSESATGVLRIEWSDDEFSAGASAATGETAHAHPALGRTNMNLWEIHLLKNRESFRFRLLYTECSLSDTDRLSTLRRESIGSFAHGFTGEVSFDLLPTFAPIGRRLVGSKPPPDWRELRGFAAWESVDPSAQGGNSLARTRSTVGLNFKPHPQVVLKADFALDTSPQDQTARVYETGLGFEF